MPPQDPDENLIPAFRNFSVLDPSATAAAGRPIFRDLEVVDIRRPGSQNYGTYPVTAFARWVEDPITREQRAISYAERFSRQYRQFKENATQTKQGTPLDHVPFLTEARRAELRALNILVIEQLADIDGQELKNLGQGGRELKNKAIEFIEVAKQTAAPSLQLQAELEAMRAKNQLLAEDNEMLRQRAGMNGAQFDSMSEEQLRGYIKDATGHAPVGNLDRKTLLRMVVDLPKRN
jgi:hypothetical protein